MNAARWRVIAAVGSAVIALSLIACSATSPSNTAGGGALSAESSSPSPIADTPSPDTPSPTPAATTTKPAQPAPTLTPRVVTPGACKTKVAGKPQTFTRARTLMDEAAGHNIYVDAKFPTTGLDTSLHGKLPVVTVPLKMLKAIAAQESSWTSTCISTDGSNSFGLMQMTDAATQTVNDHFDVSFVLSDQDTNVLLADAYLEMITVRLGIEYFHDDFNLSTNKALRDDVLAAYNTGLGVVDASNGHGITIGPYGQNYIDNIEYFMNYKPVQTQWGHCPTYC